MQYYTYMYVVLTDPGVVSEELPRVGIKDEFLQQPVAEAHDECTLYLTHVNLINDDYKQEINNTSKM